MHICALQSLQIWLNVGSLLQGNIQHFLRVPTLAYHFLSPAHSCWPVRQFIILIGHKECGGVGCSSNLPGSVSVKLVRMAWHLGHFETTEGVCMNL